MYKINMEDIMGNENVSNIVENKEKITNNKRNNIKDIEKNKENRNFKNNDNIENSIDLNKMFQNYNFSNDDLVSINAMIDLNIKCFRGIVQGQKNSKKYLFLDEIIVCLFKKNKIVENHINYINFCDIKEDTFVENKFYIIQDIENLVLSLFNYSESKSKNQLLEKIEILLTNRMNNYIIIDVEDDFLKGFYSLDSRISLIFNYLINFKDFSDQEIINLIMENFKKNNIDFLKNNSKEDLENYLFKNRNLLPFKNYDLVNYIVDYVSRNQDLKLPKDKSTSKTLDDNFNNIIGMNDVKKEIYDLKKYLEYSQKLKDNGLKLPNFNMHMMFLGSPGTGKTTVARIIAQLLFDLGYIKQNKLVEVTSSDLIGEFSGVKTNKVIMSAMGGVLFIDEAYALSNSCGLQGQEAIATLIKFMEDYKNEFVVMFAGYSQEMKAFVESNSGILSRIGYIFKINDYTNEEIFEILKLKLIKSGFEVNEESCKSLFIDLIRNCNIKRNAGNGRLADKILQRVLTHKAKNCIDNNDLIIDKDSVPNVADVIKTLRF